MNHETRTTALLDSATADLTTDVDRLVAGAVDRGRTLRRRRRVGTTLASVAVLGVIGAGASVLPGGDAPTGGHVAARGTDEPTVSTDRRFSMDPAKTAWVLSDLLPRGRVTHRDSASHPVDVERFRDATLRFNGGLVSFHAEWMPDIRDTACGQHGCEVLADGGLLWASGGEQANVVWLFTPDGWALTASAADYPEDPGDEPVADAPVLSISQLTAIVTSDVWLDDPQ